MWLLETFKYRVFMIRVLFLKANKTFFSYKSYYNSIYFHRKLRIKKFVSTNCRRLYLSGVVLQQQYKNEFLQELCSSRNVTSQDWWHRCLVLRCPSNIPKDSSLEHLGPVILMARWEQLGGKWCYWQTFPAAHP